VAAVNSSHKRLDYVVREVAALTSPRPLLLMLGQAEDETPAILRLAEQLLGAGGFAHRTVAQHEVAPYYRAADVFVLASLSEGFGRVLLEAMSQGAPCLAHNYDLTRYILGEHGLLADLSRDGELAAMIAQVLQYSRTRASNCQGQRDRHSWVHERFGWDTLAPEYMKMIRRCASLSRDEIFN
jgi:glycosyltransferase involved in cell wall biosynthesis